MTMKPLLSLLTALLPLASFALAQGPATPPREVVEDQLRLLRADLIDAKDNLRHEEEVVSDKAEEVEEVGDRIETMRDAVLEYQELLFEHQSRADDPYLTPAQRRELDRATRATRAHLQKLDQVQSQYRRELVDAQADLRQARAAVSEARSRVRAIEVQIERLKKALPPAPARR
jgi:chromosome segregation ATPase